MPKQSSMPSVKEIEQLFNSNRKVWAANERRRKAQEKKRREEEAARQEARARQRRALRRQRAAAPPPAPPPVVSGIGRVRAPRQPIYASSLVKLATGRTKDVSDVFTANFHKRGYSPQKGRPAMEQIVEQLQFAHQKRLPPGTQMYAELDAAGKKVDIYDQDDVCVSGSLYIRKAHIERRYGGRVPKGYKVTLEPIFE